MLAVAPLVDATDVIRLVGRPAFERAKSYVREHRVETTAWNADDHLLTGSVRGGDPAPYEAAVTLTPLRGDYGRPGASSCSCPVGGACKHVAALVLATNAAKVLESSQLTSTVVALPTEAAPVWRTALGALTRGTSPLSAPATPMGLQFELRERSRSHSARWGAPTSRAASARSALSAGASLRLGMRPVTKSAAGNWTRSNLTWTTLPYSLNRLGVSAEQHRWFGQFQSLHRSARDAYVPGEADWLYLDDFASPLLWPLLAEGARLGIDLVTGKRETDVRVAGSGRVTLDVAESIPVGEAGVAAGTLHVEPAVVIDDLTVPSRELGLIADHGVYRASFSPAPHFVLAPTGHLTEEVRSLLRAQGAIDVPPEGRDEFLTDFYPRLSRAIPVVSSNASVRLPEIEPPMLTLTISFAEGDRLELHWAWIAAGLTEPLAAHSVPETLEDDLGGAPTALVLHGLDAAEFVSTVLPVLESRDDLRIVQLGEKPDYRELTATPKLAVTTVETDRRDWFDLGVMVTVEGRTIPFAPLFTALSKGRDKLLLVDKTYLSLKQPVFDELKRLIAEAEALDEWETGELTISRYQASLWSEFEELADETYQAESWRETTDGLNRIAAGEQIADILVPSAVQAELRPYQVEGFRWLAFLLEHGLGGVLADDMGLGKTIQTLALIAHAKARSAEAGATDPARPFLVVAPTSVVSNWVAEANRFTPSLRVTGITSTVAKSRQRFDDIARDNDVVVTSYALLRLDLARYQEVEWSGLVLDEAQMIKNHRSKAHKAAVDLKAPFKLAITGTPLENDLMDLWALFHVVSPGLLTTGLRFTEEYLKPIELNERPDLLARLRRRIRPLMLRRTKELVASELPAKQEQILRVDLAPAHRKLYDLVLQRERMKLLDLVDDLDRNRFIVFRSLTLLRMLALDASLIDGDKYSGIPSSKLDVLLDELVDVVAGGHRALIFSQFTSYLSLVADRLDRAGIAHAYLDGGTRKRGEVIDEFKSGSAPVFLISLKAGGFGLNLTEADYVFLLDPWWNPASEAQAIDRTHRIGQTSNVMVYRMIANDTIEEKVMALKETKAKLFDAMMSDDEAAFGGALTVDDIRGLLEA